MSVVFYSEPVTRPVQLGLVIKSAREKAGMTQPTLAYLAGTTPDAISAIERGIRQPGWPTLARIAAVLDVSASDLDSAIEYEVAAARSRVPGSPRDARALREQRKRHTP